MVRRGNQDTLPKRSQQGSEELIPQASKIGASTPYDFEGKNLTAYGGCYRWPRCWRSWSSNGWSKRR
jgi:hypothetical protein